MMMPLRRRAKYWLYNFVPGFSGRFPYYGTQVHFPPGAPIFRVICEQGRFEPDIIDRLVTLARPGTTIFDVGANIGLMAIPVLRGCDSCRVVSFEPSPNSLPFLRRTADRSGFGSRWIVVGKALSRSIGELDFTIGRPEDALFEGFHSDSHIAAPRVIRVPVSTLDHEWQALGRPPVSIVKIDVEGAEEQVLSGGLGLIGGARPAVLIEWHQAFLKRFDTRTDFVLSFASDLRYRMFSIPAGIPIDDEPTLCVQMMTSSNFLLLPSNPGGG